MKNEAKTKLVFTRVDPALKRRLDRVRRARGEAEAVTVREALRVYLDAEAASNPPPLNSTAPPEPPQSPATDAMVREVASRVRRAAPRTKPQSPTIPT